MDRLTIIGALGIIKKNGKVLVALRHEPKIPELHHKWEFPGGEVEYDEHPQETVVREVEEEVGLKVKPVKLIPNILMRYFDHGQGRTKIFFMLNLER